MHTCVVCTLQVTRERPVRPDRLRGPAGAYICVQIPSKTLKVPSASKRPVMLLSMLLLILLSFVYSKPCCYRCCCYWYFCCYSFAASHVDGAVAAIQLTGISSFQCKQLSQTVYSNFYAVLISKFPIPRLAFTRKVANTLTGLYPFSLGILFEELDYLFEYP